MLKRLLDLATPYLLLAFATLAFASVAAFSHLTVLRAFGAL